MIGVYKKKSTMSYEKLSSTFKIICMDRQQLISLQSYDNRHFDRLPQKILS